MKKLLTFLIVAILSVTGLLVFITHKNISDMSMVSFSMVMIITFLFHKKIIHICCSS